MQLWQLWLQCAAGHCVAPFDRFRAIPGSMDISTSQRIHPQRRMLSTRDLPPSRAISRDLSFVNCWHQLRREGPLARVAGELGNQCELPLPVVPPLTLLWKCSTVGGGTGDRTDFPYPPPPGQRPFLPQLVSEVDETEIAGDRARLLYVTCAQHAPLGVNSLRYGDIHTAWDRPEPIKWRHTVPCGALQP